MKDPKQNHPVKLPNFRPAETLINNHSIVFKSVKFGQIGYIAVDKYNSKKKNKKLIQEQTYLFKHKYMLRAKYFEVWVKIDIV